MRWCCLRPLLLAALAALILPAAVARAEASRPIVPGFERFFAGDKADAVPGGQLLLTELNCVSCHQPADASLSRKQAPILDNVAGRIRLGYLKKFLADPQAVKPGTTMPNLLADDPDRAAKVEALVHFLATTGTLSQARPDNKVIATGRDLFHKVGCAVCHGPRDALGQPLTPNPSPPLGERGRGEGSAVPLGDLSAKYTLPSLIAFLDNPLAVRPSGRMPHVVSGKEAKDIAGYLLQGVKVDLPTGRGSTAFAYYEGHWDRLPDFDKLKPTTTGTGPAFDLGAAKRGNDFGLKFDGVFKVEKEGSYRFHLTSDDGSRLLIDGKPVVNNDSVHPATTADGAVALTKGLHKVAVLYFQVSGEIVLDVQVEGPGLGQQSLAALVAATPEGLEARPAPPKKPVDDDTLEVRPDLAEKGKALFASLGCASCHQLTGPDKKPILSVLKAPALATLKSTGGCLASKPAKGLPIYSLADVQRRALAAALKTPTPPSKDPAAVIARTMTTFNCYACHTRDKIGGPMEETNKLFQTTQQEMGEEGRVPPPLDGVGAKLNLDYLKQILDHGAHDRPYMHTRMPGFGLANLGTLPEALATDTLPVAPPVKFAVPVAKVKSTGRFLVGAQALSCFKCHTFAGQKAEGVQGIDMILMTRRLRRDWFQAYLLNPQKVRPGTRMPAAWPDGKTFYPNLLDGQTPTQIEAIWVYLQDGAAANRPAGLGRQYIPLIPDRDAIIYRNFIEGAGTRAIGVGYPEKLNLAFDANELRLALLWRGAFIDAGRHWSDRGDGQQPPLGDDILKLPAGASFAVLDKSDAAWPTTAPKQQGWKFKGYRLTSDDRPTFQYALGDVKIEDFPNPTSDKEPTLRRILKLTAEKGMSNLYFRAAVGTKIEAQKNGWFSVDGWKMKIEGGRPILRQSGGKAELLVPITFKNGKAEIVQEFVW
jgi:mono/diheme cytochrome c family protein